MIGAMENLLEMANSVGIDTFIEKPLDSIKIETHTPQKNLSVFERFFYEGY